VNASNGSALKLPLGPGVELVAEDAHGMLAFAKPEGVLSHPNEPRDAPRSLLTAPYRLDAECYVLAGDAGATDGRVYLLNRLDSGTSGVVLACRDEALAKEVRAQFRQHRVEKRYVALVFGSPTPRVQVWRDRLAVRREHGTVRSDTGGNVPAETRMEVLGVRPGTWPLALLQLDPRTGRSHQLRVQCAARHLPIVGDGTYGNFGANREFAKATTERRMFLHSLRTAFRYRWGGRDVRFAAEAPLPEAFRAALGPGRRSRG
jgi:tRNA pseudouridine65 synthase